MGRLTVDLETTGLDIESDSPIELGVIAERPAGCPPYEYDTLIRSVEEVPPEIYRITGISTAALINGGIPPIEASKKWTSIVWDNQPVTLVGYNVIAYDFPLLMAWINRIDDRRFKFPPIEKILDLQRVTSRALNTRKWLTLKAAADAFGIKYNEEDLHGALADARLTRELYFKLEARGFLDG